MSNPYLSHDETLNYLTIQDFYLIAEENPEASFDEVMGIYISAGYHFDERRIEYAKKGYDKFQSRKELK